MERWCYKKLNLPKDYCGLLAKDWNDEGAKAFKAFTKEIDMISYLEENKGKNLYEVIDGNKPCMLYFDIDRGDTIYNEDRVISSFLNVLDNFLSENFGIRGLTVGENVHICTATTDSKVSFHVVAHVKIKSVSILKNIVVLLIEKLISKQSETPRV